MDNSEKAKTHSTKRDEEYRAQMAIYLDELARSVIELVTLVLLEHSDLKNTALKKFSWSTTASASCKFLALSRYVNGPLAAKLLPSLWHWK